MYVSWTKDSFLLLQKYNIAIYLFVHLISGIRIHTDSPCFRNWCCPKYNFSRESYWIMSNNLLVFPIYDRKILPQFLLVTILSRPEVQYTVLKEVLVEDISICLFFNFPALLDVIENRWIPFWFNFVAS